MIHITIGYSIATFPVLPVLYDVTLAIASQCILRHCYLTVNDCKLKVIDRDIYIVMSITIIVLLAIDDPNGQEKKKEWSVVHWVGGVG